MNLKYILYIAKNYSIPVFDPLVRFLEKSGELYAFYIAEKVKNSFPENWSKSKILTSLKQAKNFKADYVLCTGNFVDFRIPGIKVQMFHGLGVEKAVHYKIRHFFDVYLTSGPYVTTRFEKMRQKYKYFLVRETGWPKVDYILNYLPKESNKPNIPPDKKIILYAPTFSTQHQSASALLEMFPAIIKENEFWFIKFHELMDKEIIKKYKQINSKKCRVLDDVEITPYLHAADLMVSDTSSVVYEFMILDKPVVTFRNSGKNMEKFNVMELSRLREIIDQNLADKNLMREHRMKILKEINPNLESNVSQKIFDTLVEIKKNKLMPEFKKPLNLFRKAQIIYHGAFKKGYLR